MIKKELGCAVAAAVVVISTLVHADPESPADAHNRKLAEDFAAIRAELPKRLAAMPLDQLCVAFGETARFGGTTRIGFDDALLPMLRTELKRRRISVNEKQIDAVTVRIGDHRCQVYASLGEPRSANRTITSRAESIQHAYDTTYIYTTNNVVRAIQD